MNNRRIFPFKLFPSINSTNPITALDEISSNINERGPLKQVIIDAFTQLDGHFNGFIPKDAETWFSEMRIELT
jgi:hypothetical protein